MPSQFAAGMFQLKTTFPEHVHLGNDPRYNTSNNEAWTPSVILNPACIFTPTTPEQVTQALKVISATQTPFAVRGGGRNTNIGWANINEGVLISTSELKGLEFDDYEGKKILRVGVGVTQIDIFELLKDTGLAISTSNIAAPGIAGFILGGGVGPYYNKVGYSANTVVNFEIALPTGELLNANLSSHPDLFWALKGGLSNFGIVTRIDFTLFPTQNIWAGANIFFGPKYEAALGVMSKYVDRETHDENTAVTFLGIGKGKLMVSLFYDGSEGEGSKPPSVLQEFLALEPQVNTLKRTSLLEMAKGGLSAFPSGLQRYWSTLTIHKDPHLLTKLFNHYHTSSETSLSHIEGANFQIAAHVLSPSFLAKNANSPLSIKDNGDSLISIFHLTTWTHFSDNKTMKSWTEKITSEMSEMARQEGKLHKYIYPNDANEKQDVFAGYGSENVERMREVSRKYDPERVMQKLQGGGVKLGL